MHEKTTIARPYSQAAFELAQEEDRLHDWAAMLQLLGMVVSNPAMASAIKNPRLEREKLAGIVIEICRDRLTETFRNFVRLLAYTGRLHLAPQIQELFEKKRTDAEGIARVTVTSAYPLEDDQEEKIRKIMAKRTGKKVEIDTRVDESLIGGVVIRAGDSVIDASLRGRLKQLSHNFAA